MLLSALELRGGRLLTAPSCPRSRSLPKGCVPTSATSAPWTAAAGRSSAARQLPALRVDGCPPAASRGPRRGAARLPPPPPRRGVAAAAEKQDGGGSNFGDDLLDFMYAGKKLRKW